MPHFLSQTDVPLELREQHLARYRSQLRSAMLNPGLSEDQRQNLKRRLLELGKPKTYRADSPPPPGAIDPGTGEPSPILLSRSALQRLPKSDLLTVARGEGALVTPDMTKARIVETILAHR